MVDHGAAAAGDDDQLHGSGDAGECVGAGDGGVFFERAAVWGPGTGVWTGVCGGVAGVRFFGGSVEGVLSLSLCVGGVVDHGNGVGLDEQSHGADDLPHVVRFF